MTSIALAWWIMVTTSPSSPAIAQMLGPYPSLGLCRRAGHEAMPRERQFMTADQRKAVDDHLAELTKRDERRSKESSEREKRLKAFESAIIPSAKVGSIQTFEGRQYEVIVAHDWNQDRHQLSEVHALIPMLWTGYSAEEMAAPFFAYDHDRSPYRPLTGCISVK